MKKKVLAIILFGSIWGLLECSLGDYLHTHGIGAGIIMAGIAFSIMAYTRFAYDTKGMQLCMASIAAIMRHFNPMGGCLLCASISIFVEGLVFEALWIIPWHKEKSNIIRMGMGAISGYSIYSIGYIATQIITPMITSKFYLRDLISNLPIIIAGATYALIIGAVMLPLILAIPKEIKIRNTLYYTASAAIIALSWIAVIAGI
ncbi:MAG: hypothetical protein J7K47_03960 [Thermoplasmata archaeon]|nr:hypothetical protein [Thermoplasmata archaeon]